MKKLNQICVLVLAVLAAAPLSAQNWTGNVNSDWNNPANWSTAPGNGDDIVIDPADYTGAMASPVVTATSAFTPAEMLVQNGAQLTISGNLNASDRVEVLGDGTIVTITGGTFALNGGGNNARLIFAEDAHLQMEGGILNIGQRLLFELGGTGEINAGTITIGETIALIDGSVTQASKLVQNGGSITTNGEFGFENEEGNFVTVFEQTGGQLHINGALIWLGAAPGSGRGIIRSSGGAVFVTGTIGNDPASTMGMQIELFGTSSVLQHSGTAVQLLAGDSIVLRNGAQWLEINTSAWQNNGVLHADNESLFQSGNTTLNGTGSYQFGRLNIPALKTLTHLTPAAISVNGNMDIAGMFTHGSNRLILNGEIQQTVNSTTGLLTVYDLRINNAANGPAAGGYGVTLNNGLLVSHNLDLADGILELASGQVLNMPDNATITGGTDTTFIDGIIVKTGNDALTFPVGKTPDRYRPLTITAPASSATAVQVEYVFSAYPTLSPVEAPLQSVSSIEYWNLSRLGSSDLFAVSAGWNDASQSGLTNCGDISLAAWNGTQWAFIPSTASGLCDGTNEGTLNGSSSLPFIGPVTIGFTENVMQNAVQVCAGGSVTVDTNTYTETGVYTDVLEDLNGDDSTIITILTVIVPPVSTITNNVTSLVVSAPGATAYQWIDCGNGNAIVAGETSDSFFPAVNGSYAVIVSANGCSDTSECALIDELSVGENMLNANLLYPNPVASHGMLVLPATGIGNVLIHSVDGRNIHPVGITLFETTTTIELPELTAGTYLLTATGSGGHTIISRFIVN